MQISIISDNCWGLGVYKALGEQYNTPFVGTLIHTPDYVSLLEQLYFYLEKPLEFIEFKDSKYYNTPHNIAGHGNVIGMLDNIEIMFPHVKTRDLCREQWNRRKSRLLTSDKILAKIGSVTVVKHKFVDYKNHFDLYKRFYNIPLFNKISFTGLKYDFPNNFKIREEHLWDSLMCGIEYEKYKIPLLLPLQQTCVNAT